MRRPDDDIPRLVFADWLDEHDQPDRAAFIRAQCELARLPAGDPRAKALERRTDPVAAWKAWPAVFHDPARAHVTLDFRRGFPATLRAGTDRVAPAFTELSRRYPIQHLHVLAPVDRPPESLAPLAEAPHLDRVRTVHLERLPDSAIHDLLAAPRLDGLADLRLEFCHLDDAVMARLADRFGPTLRGLAVRGGWPAAVAATGFGLVRRAWPGLTRLELENCGLRADGLAAVAEWAGFLRVLHLGDQRVQWPDALAAVRRLLPTVRSLSVCAFGGSGWGDGWGGRAAERSALRLGGWLAAGATC